MQPQRSREQNQHLWLPHETPSTQRCKNHTHGDLMLPPGKRFWSFSACISKHTAVVLGKPGGTLTGTCSCTSLSLRARQRCQRAKNTLCKQNLFVPLILFQLSQFSCSIQPVKNIQHFPKYFKTSKLEVLFWQFLNCTASSLLYSFFFFCIKNKAV